MSNLFHFFLFFILFGFMCLLISQMCYEEGMDDGDIDFDSV